MKVVSLFTGAGGLDLGFKKAGFEIIWMNEFDKHIWPTLEYNFPSVELEKRSIVELSPSDIPSADGIIGGPPCQSWSVCGWRKCIDDERGRLMFNYIDIIKKKLPYFFLIENVPGITMGKARYTYDSFIEELSSDYSITHGILNAFDYGVPQTRKRVFIVGYRKDLGRIFRWPKKVKVRSVLKDAIYDLWKDKPALPGAVNGRHANPEDKLNAPNHEYLLASFSPRYIKAFNVRCWNEPSYTIVATGKHTPMHPQVCEHKQSCLERIKSGNPKEEHFCRRLSIRECARIQTFPDDFIFKYKYLVHGYTMVGNAVPVKLAHALAEKIKEDLINPVWIV